MAELNIKMNADDDLCDTVVDHAFDKHMRDFEPFRQVFGSTADRFAAAQTKHDTTRLRLVQDTVRRRLQDNREADLSCSLLSSVNGSPRTRGNSEASAFEPVLAVRFG